MGDVYQAEKILDTKLIKGRRYFYIKWHGWDDKHNTWEPKRNIIDTRLIDIYFKNLNKKSSKSEISTKRDKSKERSKTITQDKHSTCYDFSDEDSNETDISNNLLKTDLNKSSAENIKTNQTNSKLNSSNSQDDAIRSAIREAGGLRPIVKQQQQQQSNSSFKKVNLSSKKLTDESDSESVDNDQHINDSKTKKELCKQMKKTKKFIKLNKRRKISSSRSFSSSSSSLIPNKKRITSMSNKIKYSDDEYEDYNSNEDEQEETNIEANEKKKITRSFKKETKLVSQENYNNRETYRIQNEIFTDENENDVGETSFDDSSTMLTMISNSDDVFITDVTSGVVTVTIKECISMDGFFKKRVESDM